MRLLVSLLATLSAAPAVAQEPPPGDGPRGTSQAAPSADRYDAVGDAAAADLPGVAATSAALPPGDYAEITALDSGKTVLVAIVAGAAPGALIGLSPAAMTALGLHAGAPVRVRRITPSRPDATLLRLGQATSPRIDAPEVLLVALRKRRPPARPVAESAERTPATARPSAAAGHAATARLGYYVHVAALSDAGRARALAAALGGTVEPAGKLFRVKLGPFPDAAAAARGRAAAAQRGYDDARIVRGS